MPTRARRLALMAHVTVSVGWLGAVIAFLALAVVGLASNDTQLVRSVYLVTVPITWFVIVPLALGSLATGLISSLGTTWGLFRHYWILFKLILDLFAIAFLLLFAQTVDQLSYLARDPNAEAAQLQSPTFLLHSGVALVLLLVATALGMYKPRGMTQYGQRKQPNSRAAVAAPADRLLEAERPNDEP